MVLAYAATWSLASIVIYGMVVDLANISTSEAVDEYVLLLGTRLLPIGIGIAILRHNLYDIDHLINRTLVYGSMIVSWGHAPSAAFYCLGSCLPPSPAATISPSRVRRSPSLR